MGGPNSERIITPMPKSLVQAIDDFRFTNRVASRAKTIRDLIELGLKAAKEKPKVGGATVNGTLDRLASPMPSEDDAAANVRPARERHTKRPAKAQAR